MSPWHKIFFFFLFIYLWRRGSKNVVRCASEHAFIVIVSIKKGLYLWRTPCFWFGLCIKKPIRLNSSSGVMLLLLLFFTSSWFKIIQNSMNPNGLPWRSNTPSWMWALPKKYPLPNFRRTNPSDSRCPRITPRSNVQLHMRRTKLSELSSW